MNFESFGFQNKKEKINNKEIENSPEEVVENKKTPLQLRVFGNQMVNLFCKNFSVEGEDNIKKAKENISNGRFIISSSHLNNLDVPAALKAMGDDFNIQMTGESVLLENMKKYGGHNLLIHLGRRKNFTPLDYKEDENGKHGSFNPDNFVELEEKIVEEGKTPWIASHPFALDGKMKRPSVGPIYLAIKTKSSIIPTALDVSGGSENLEGAAESAKALVNRAHAVYHIGEAMEVPDIDISIIEKVLNKRKNREPISREEMEEFSLVHKELNEQAEILSDKIASLLPEEKRLHHEDETKVGQEEQEEKISA